MKVLDSMAKIMREFKEKMPLELPKELPPRLYIDHKIELCLGAKPLAQVP